MSESNPVLARIEKKLCLSPGIFSELGYQSVFDIVSMSKKSFMDKHQWQLGEDCEEAYALAVGVAHYVRRQFLKFREHKAGDASQQEPMPRLLQGSENVLMAQEQASLPPTWNNLFNEEWLNYCQEEAPEANNSPVAYLTWLYHRAQEFENDLGANDIVTLNERRPDLGAMLIDDNAINQVVPALQLVNEVLDSTISPWVKEKTPDTTVNKTLSSTRYPSPLPYYFPHDQAKLALDNVDVSLNDIISQSDTQWPYFLSNSKTGDKSEHAIELESYLSPAQVTLLTEKVSADSSFYLKNLGLDTSSYTPFTDSEVLCAQTNMTQNGLEELLSSTQGGSRVVASPNCISVSPSSATFASSYINGYLEPALTLNSSPAVCPDDNQESLTIVLNDKVALCTDGRFGEGITLDARENAQAYIPLNLGYDRNKLKDFSLAFWCRLESEVKDLAIITTNKLKYYAASDIGITLFVTMGTDKKAALKLNCSDGKTQLDVTSNVICPQHEWFFVAINQDAAKKKLDLYCSVDGKTLSHSELNFAQINTIGYSGALQGFNGNKDNQYYNYLYSERRMSMSFDDITTWDKVLMEDEIIKFVTSGIPKAGYSTMTHYYPLDTTDINFLSNDRMQRINRMVRLQRWLGLPYDKVDLLLNACIAAQGVNNSDYQLNNHIVRMLGVFRHYQQHYQVTPEQFSAVIYQLTPYAVSPEVPFIDRVFNSPSLFETPFTLTDATFNYRSDSETDSRIVKQLCAGLGLNQAEFLVIADEVARSQGDVSKHTLACSLKVVSALYRLAMLPRWLGLSFAEGMSLFTLLDCVTTLSGVPQLAKLTGSPAQPDKGDLLDMLMALSQAVEWSKTHSLSWMTEYLQLQPASDSLVPSSETVNFITQINQQLPATLLSEQSFTAPGIPQSGQNSSGVFTCNDFTPVAKVVSAAYQMDSAKGQKGQFTAEANALTKGNKIYTIGVWFYADDPLSTSTPLISCHATGTQKAATGINISFESDYRLKLRIEDNKGLAITGNSLIFSKRMWHYFVLCLDTQNKKLTAYLCNSARKIQTATLDYSSLSGSVVIPEGQGWYLNDNGSGNYYQNNKNSHALLSFDEVSIWDTLLTQQQVQEIYDAKKPAKNTKTPKLCGLQGLKDIAWMQMLPDLIDEKSGLVLPEAKDLPTIQERVANDLAGFIFSDNEETERVIDVVATVIYQALRAQNSIADSALSQRFSVDQSATPKLFAWSNDSEYRLLSECLAYGDNLDITSIHLEFLKKLYELGRRASVVNSFRLTASSLETLLAHPEWFALNDVSLTLKLLYRLSRYQDLLALSQSEDAVCAYLRSVNAPTPDATTAASQLAELVQWDSKEVAIAAGVFGTGGVAKTLENIDGVMRLHTLCNSTGLSAAPLLSTADLTLASDWNDWQAVGEALMAAQSPVAVISE
ncbi:Tc toxin subunit A [Nissabacter sp. SGAir0207]|uniref:Tc toxin subunit A n=1 Tax=Nissabacter sp. SGAir0207 TaxID=2126321 RepID=UPI0010CD0D40|nr:Tc toxin subunit A [Nissabacter sp. SGAir0207]QCR35054.1 hypothetical protein C1N62_02610 [Nissabacter sp. SGAir0207]